MPADENIHRELGVLSTELLSLKAHIEELRHDLRETRDTVLQAKGSWKAVATLASVVGGVAGFLLSIFKVKVGTS